MLLVSVGVTLALYFIPYGDYVAYPLVLISTLVHELGHGVAAMLAGATFHEFHMFRDGSGVALWSGAVSNPGKAFIAAGGLVGPAVGAAVCLASARRVSTTRYCLMGIGFLLVIAEIFVVRNGFGVMFVGVLAAICLALAFWASDQLAQLGLVFLAVQLALSVYSRGDYLFTKYAITRVGKMPSDVQHMAEVMPFPYWFWGGVCALFSAAVLIFGGLFFVRGGSSGKGGSPSRGSSQFSSLGTS